MLPETASSEIGTRFGKVVPARFCPSPRRPSLRHRPAHTHSGVHRLMLLNPLARDERSMFEALVPGEHALRDVTKGPRIGVLAPYGNGRELQAFINVAPSIGAAIGGGS